MTHAIFGELELIDGYVWEGDSVSALFGEEKTIDLYVYVDEDEKIIERDQCHRPPILSSKSDCILSRSGTLFCQDKIG